MPNSQHPTNKKPAPRNARSLAPTAKRGGRAQADDTSGGSRSWVASAVGFTVAASVAGVAAWGLGIAGCDAEDGTTPSDEARTSEVPARAPSADETPEPASSADAPTAEAEGEAADEPHPFDQPWDGPWLGVTAFQTPVYAERRFSKKRIGYVRKGGKVPIDSDPVKTKNCKKGWYELVDGGYICGKYATTDLKNPGVRLGVKAPDLEATVPYKYAYNRMNGTPLYTSVPSKEDMLKYEPYLEEERRKKAAKKAAKNAEKNGGDSADDKSAKKPANKKPSSKSAKRKPSDEEDVAAARVPAGAGGGSAEENLANIDPGEDLEEPEEKPWWQTKPNSKEVDITLAELAADADSNLNRRMVKGFFISVDKTFGWNDRLWYKTTSGLVAPSDRMYINKPPDTEGTHWPEGAKQVGFATAGKAFRYDVDPESGTVKKGQKLKRFAAFGLTGKKTSIKDTVYRETVDGWWMKGAQGTFTEPNARPSDVDPKEKWIDVNLTRKTLVAFEGDRPVYAALVSPGKKSRNRKKDHRTPVGKWRIREKHIAVTMDGDGVAGDVPYSIEDVPYVAYYKGSYALHGAFWHNNFGREMSHGCVNLAPKDAKHIFFWSEPRLPRGWHAVWSSDERPGTMVVAHE